MTTPEFSIEKNSGGGLSCTRLLNKEGVQVFCIYFFEEETRIVGQESMDLGEFETDLFWAQKALEIAKEGNDKLTGE